MRSLGKLILSRLAIFSAVVAVEVAILLTVVISLSQRSVYFLVLILAVNLFALVVVVNSEGNPEYKLTWLGLIAVVPGLGAMLYLFYRKSTMSQKEKNALDKIRAELSACQGGVSNLKALSEKCTVAAGRARAILNTDKGARLYTNTNSRYFSSGSEMYQSMLSDLEKAEKYILLEYFIIEMGQMWQGISDILLRKAAAGVEVRLMYDDVGCLTCLPRGFAKEMARGGVKIVRFSRITPSLRYMRRNNNRDHRKLLVIDGVVAYTGGLNVGDEYIGIDMRLGAWRDAGVRVSGDAVLGFVAMFFELWCFATKKEERLSAYFPHILSKEGDGGYYIPFASGPTPMYPDSTGKRAIVDIISGAQAYVYILTPYLIIDFDLTEALLAAALRGVDVRIITPGVPDKPLIKLLTSAAYPTLLSGGVKVYEYMPGFLHAKSIVVDDLYAIIGTINLDYRSLVHHYEDAVWIYSSATVISAKNDFFSVLASSEPVTARKTRTHPFGVAVRCLMRLFAPLF